jgi:hypothetical protein
MTELSGTLDGIGLFALLNFLAGLKSRGRLAITDRELSGALYFTDGRVVGASFGNDSGEVALDAIGLALGQGRFSFADEGGEQPTNLRMDGPELQQHLEHLQAERARIMSGIPSLDSVPRVNIDDGADDQAISLDRGTLRLLVKCDGQLSVLDLAREAGLLSTLKRLANLHEQQLISVDGSSASPSQPQAPQWTQEAPAPQPIQEEPAPQAPQDMAEDTIVLTRPPSIPTTPAPPPAPTPEPAREPADATSHPRRPWWQGEGP